MPHQEIFNLLTKEYTLILATTKEHFNAVKKVRSDVFQHKYSIYPELKNSNWYLFSKDDIQSFIYLLRNNTSNTYVGTVRVFFINHKTPINQLPMQKDGDVKGIQKLTHKIPICEISRLNLLSDLPKHSKLSTLRLRTYLSLGLMIATRINFFLYNYNKIFAIMEDSLERILTRQGVHFQQIGETINYYGKRTPFGIDKNPLLIDTDPTMGKITRYYLKELCKNPEPFWEFIDQNPYLEREDIELERICKLFEEYGDDADLALLMGEEEPEVKATP